MGLSVTIPQIAARAPFEKSATPKNNAVRIAAVVAPVLLLIVLNVLGRADLDPMLRLLASAMCFLGCLPAAMHTLRRDTSLPFMPLYALLFAGYFAVPVFLDEKFALPMAGVSISDPVIIDAEAVLLLGFVMLLVGFYFPGERFLARVPRMRQGLDESTGVQMGWSLVGFGLLFVQVRNYVPVRFQSFGAIIQQLGSLGLALLFYYYLRGRLRGPQVYLLIVLIPAMAVVDLSGGGVGPILQNVLPLVGTYWLVHRKLLWKTTLIVVLLVIPISGVKARFRAVAWDPTANMGVVERTILFYDLIKQGFQTEEGFYYNCFEITVVRMNEVPTMAAVQTLTPSVIPYWGGATYQDLYWSLIPRFLYPDKPGKVLGQDFGHRYGLLDKFDKTTSYNFPQAVEFYANFGVWGVAAGMLMLGFAQRLLYHVTTAPDAHPSVYLFATIILAHCCNIDSDLSIVYGGLLFNVIAIIIVLAVLRARHIHLPLDVLRFRW